MSCTVNTSSSPTSNPTSRPTIQPRNLPISTNTCWCSTTSPNAQPFNFSANDGAGPVGGLSYEVPTLLDEQFAVLGQFTTRLSAMIRPGDIINGTVTPQLSVEFYSD